jgi:hypothetical protein
VNLRQFLGFEFGTRRDSPLLGLAHGDTIGACLFEFETRTRIAVGTALAPRDGDWVLAKLAGDDVGLVKWFLIVDGTPFVACKWYALPVTNFVTILGVVVSILRWPRWWRALKNPAISAEQERRVHLMRSHPPVRKDLIIFPQDIIGPEKIREAIRAHLTRQRAG